MNRIIFTVIFILLVVSCSNYVRNDPERVKNLNSTEWTIKSEPKTVETELRPYRHAKIDRDNGGGTSLPCRVLFVF